MVNIPEFYTSSKQQGCSHSCPLLGSDPYFVLCTGHVKCHETSAHGLACLSAMQNMYYSLLPVLLQPANLSQTQRDFSF